MPKQQLEKYKSQEENDYCCVCTKSGNNFSKITEHFIKINSKFVSLREIILDQLSLIYYEVR